MKILCACEEFNKRRKTMAKTKTSKKETEKTAKRDLKAKATKKPAAKGSIKAKKQNQKVQEALNG